MDSLVRPAGPPRRAFTALEVLVVLAILVLFLGLLVPAVQKVRAAAARLACSNNLKQMATALRGYHDVHGHFPPGGMHLPPHHPCGADPSATTPQSRAPSWSWAYQILPHIGQQELYRTPDCGLVRAAPVKTFYCPARRPPQTFAGAAKMDYAGCAGDRPDGANGIIMRSDLGVVRTSDIADGLAGTVMLGEKQLNRAMFGRSRDDDEAYCTAGWNDDWEVYRGGAAPPRPDVSAPDDVTPSRVFGSSHPGGFQGAFADGSVRFIRYTVNPTAWQRACVRDDAQQVNPNNL